jgi:hypothetical protein
VFLLQTNAWLWSGAAPATNRVIDEPLQREFPVSSYTGQATFLPATPQPPRVPIELAAQRIEPQTAGDEALFRHRIDPFEMVISGQENVDEFMRPGIVEWGLTHADGRGLVIPDAAVIQVGEGELKRADSASIVQQFLPLEVKFVTSSAWSEQNQTAGSSTLTLLLLGLLAAMLAVEQLLAYWASYHVRPDRYVAAQPHSGRSSTVFAEGGSQR